MSQKNIITLLLIMLPVLSFCQKTLDVVYLKNGSVIKGEITEMVFNERVTVKTTDNRVLVFKAENISKIEKESVDAGTGSQQQKSILGKVLEQVLTGNEDRNSRSTTTLPDSENTRTEKEQPTGSLCFSNKNMYQRKIVLKHRVSGELKTLVIGLGNNNRATTSCLYDIPVGVYECLVYTTFTHKVIEQFEIKVETNQTQKVELATNHYN